MGAIKVIYTCECGNKESCIPGDTCVPMNMLCCFCGRKMDTEVKKPKEKDK